MARYLGPVCRLCRREGEKLFLKGQRCFTPKCSFEKRAYAPGQHGKTGGSHGPQRESIMPANCAESKKLAGCMVFSSVNSAAILALPRVGVA